MDNKLSELSKPVMYSLRFRNMHTGEPDKNINANTTFSTLEKARAYGLGIRYVTQDDGKIVNVRDPSQDPIVEPLYSQEYVSALLAERDAFEASALAMRDEWRARGERIAELEATEIKPDGMKLMSEAIGAHGYIVGCLVQGRPDLALEESRKWVDAFSQAAELINNG